MSNKDNFRVTLEEIRDIYIFLTEKEPTPDDEIIAREELIRHFKNLMSINRDPANFETIQDIYNGLNEWDTLDLWFSETTLPNKMAELLNLPEQLIKRSEETMPQESELIEENEIDLTEIFNKVSEQFQGEIESLRGKIEALKKQLEQKDEKLKNIEGKKKMQKISPKREVKLAPPKIKIPILKKTVQPPFPESKASPSDSVSEKLPKEPPKPRKSESPTVKVEKEALTPIPSVQEKRSELEKIELKPAPKSKPLIESIVIEESKDKPIATEKRKLMPIISETETKLVEEFKEKVPLFSVEKPKITSVNIEEIDHESIKSTSSDLFNVFSSIGSKDSTVSEDNLKDSQEIIGNMNQKLQSKPVEIKIEPKSTSSFINFNQNTTKPKIQEPSTQEDLSTDKDSLYQELIALEGKRYAIEKSYKDLDRNYGKGSIADSAYKVQSEKLKVQLDEITSRINSIRRLISSL